MNLYAFILFAFGFWLLIGCSLFENKFVSRLLLVLGIVHMIPFLVSMWIAAVL